MRLSKGFLIAMTTLWRQLRKSPLIESLSLFRNQLEDMQKGAMTTPLVTSGRLREPESGGVLIWQLVGVLAT